MKFKISTNPWVEFTLMIFYVWSCEFYSFKMHHALVLGFLSCDHVFFMCHACYAKIANWQSFEPTNELLEAFIGLISILRHKPFCNKNSLKTWMQSSLWRKIKNRPMHVSHSRGRPRGLLMSLCQSFSSPRVVYLAKNKCRYRFFAAIQLSLSLFR